MKEKYNAQNPVFLMVDQTVGFRIVELKQDGKDFMHCFNTNSPKKKMTSAHKTG